MFSLARQLVRHKIGFVAVAAFAVVMFAGDGEDEEAAKPSSPWSKQAPAQVAATQTSDEDDSVSAKLGEVAAAASEVAAEKILGDKDLSPVKMGGEAVDNFNNTNEAFAKANGNN